MKMDNLPWSPGFIGIGLAGGFVENGLRYQAINLSNHFVQNLPKWSLFQLLRLILLLAKRLQFQGLIRRRK